jgi:hypothetical protein
MLFSEKLVRFMPKNVWENQRRGDGQSHVLLGIVFCRRVFLLEERRRRRSLEQLTATNCVGR